MKPARKLLRLGFTCPYSCQPLSVECASITDAVKAFRHRLSTDAIACQNFAPVVTSLFEPNLASVDGCEIELFGRRSDG
ncbi:MAG: hypothetical protein N3B10_07200 [Armatimonadetes bacterium]|nr:hypothetical protein [Armatimonadota bacterium]